MRRLQIATFANSEWGAQVLGLLLIVTFAINMELSGIMYCTPISLNSRQSKLKQISLLNSKIRKI